MIPALVVLLIVVAIRACTLPGAEAGIEFLFKPSTENVMSSGGWLTVFGIALAQMFFSLNVGFGTNLMYGSYAPDDSDLGKNALLVPLGDMVVALLAALATIPAAFAFGYSPSAGAGMLFITMKAVFESMPGGAHFRLPVLRCRVLCRYQLRDRYDRCQRRPSPASTGAGATRRAPCWRWPPT